jgi:HSP20 family protein
MTAHRIVPRRIAGLDAPTFFGPRFNLDRFFGDLPLIARSAVPAENRSFVPAVNVEETDAELRLSAELPGLEGGDFEVTTDGDLLTIRGEKKIESTPDENGCRRIERSHGAFERSFRVAWEIDSESVKAVYKNGVLDLVIPKPEAEKSQVRTIPVVAS